jgi:hypothetical protein
MTKLQIIKSLRERTYPYIIDGHTVGGKHVVTWHVDDMFDLDAWVDCAIHNIVWSVR